MQPVAATLVRDDLEIFKFSRTTVYDVGEITKFSSEFGQ
jgi:hypothetical protein